LAEINRALVSEGALYWRHKVSDYHSPTEADEEAEAEDCAAMAGDPTVAWDNDTFDVGLDSMMGCVGDD
jgi:hypothetical protein